MRSSGLMQVREEMKILENQIMIRAGMKRHKGSFIGIGILLFLTALSLTTVLMIALVGNGYIREEMERAGFGDRKSVV